MKQKRAVIVPEARSLFSALVRDPKVWAIVFLAWALQFIFNDVKGNMVEIRAMVSDNVATGPTIVGLQSTQIQLLKQSLNMQTQACVNIAGDDMAKRARCFDVLNGSEPR